MTGAIISAVLGALASFLLKLLAQNQVRQSDVALGGATVAAKINQEAADADKRASEAAINQPDVGGMLDDLNAGKF